MTDILDIIFGIVIAVIAHRINKWLDSKEKNDS